MTKSCMKCFSEVWLDGGKWGIGVWGYSLHCWEVGGGGGGAKDSNESLYMSLHVIVSVLKRNESAEPTHTRMHAHTLCFLHHFNS